TACKLTVNTYLPQDKAIGPEKGEGTPGRDPIVEGRGQVLVSGQRYECDSGCQPRDSLETWLQRGESGRPSHQQERPHQQTQVESRERGNQPGQEKATGQDQRYEHAALRGRST